MAINRACMTRWPLHLALAIAIGACSTTPPPEAGTLRFEPTLLALSMNVAEVREPDITLRSTLPNEVEYELLPPPVDDAPDEPTLFVDIDPTTIEESIPSGASQHLRLLVQCPVVPGTYGFTLTVKWGTSTTDLRIEAECQDAPIPTVVAEHTKVTDAATRLALLSYDFDSGILEFAAANAFLAALQVDDVLASEPTDVAPDGFLRRITGIRNEAGRVLLDTVQAGLDEAFIQMSIDEDYSPDTLDLENLVLLQDRIEAAVGSIDSQATLSFTFNEVVFDGDGNPGTTDDQFRVNGTLAIQPSFQFRASLTTHYEYVCIGFRKWGKCYGFVARLPTSWSTYFYGGTTITEHADLRAAGAVPFARDAQFPIARYDAPPTIFLVGPVPVVVTHTLTFFIDADLTITGRLDYQVQQVASITAGLEYEGRLRPIFSKSFSSTDTLDFFGEFTASNMIGTRWESKLYGALGPFLQHRAGIRLSATLASAPSAYSWRLDACTDASAGLTHIFKIFTSGLDPISLDLFEGCSLLRQGQLEVPTPASITHFTAAPETITAGESSTLTWDVAGTTPITLTIDQGVGDVSGQASVTVNPTATTSYTLTAMNSAGSDNRQVTLTVVPRPVAPSIERFSAEPSTIAAGESSTLSWDVTGTSPITLTIDQGAGDVSGQASVAVSPSGTTTYTLTAANSAGSRTASATVTVPTGPQTLLVSAADGSTTAGNSVSASPSISANGRYVAFHSDANNLVPGVSGDQVYLRDTQTNITILVSATNESMAAGNHISHSPSISADGRYVAFTSWADSLVTGVSGEQVYLRDTQTNTTLLVSAANGSTTPARNQSSSPSISADGRYVAFHSDADNLAPGVSGWQVYLRDTQTNTTLLASAANSSTMAGNDTSRYPSISADGRFVTFSSWAENLVPGVSGWQQQIYLRNTQTNTTLLVSAANGSMTSANSRSYVSSISVDGSLVAFYSDASNLVPAVSGSHVQVYLRNTQTNTTLLVSAADDSMTPGSDNSGYPSISADGRLVAFYSWADNLVPGVSSYQVYLRDTQTNTTLLVSAANGSMTPGNDRSEVPSISADGRRLAFHSNASNLVPGASGQQVYLRIR